MPASLRFLRVVIATAWRWPGSIGSNPSPFRRSRPVSTAIPTNLRPRSPCVRSRRTGAASSVSSSAASAPTWRRYTGRSLPEPISCLQILQLVVRAGSPQHVVAMREAAEAGDDVAMLDGILRHLRIVERNEQSAAHLLVRQ